MSMNLSGSVGPRRPSDVLGGPTGPVDKVGVGAPQTGAAEGAGAAGAVGGIDLPKVTNEIAKSLTSAADKFKMLSGLNPFSQNPAVFDAFSKAKESMNAAVDAFKSWGKAIGDQAGELGKGLDQQIHDWGKSIREQAEKDKQAHLEDQIKKQVIGPQYTKGTPSQTNPANLAE